MNKEWSLDALYLGYDDPKWEKDQNDLTELNNALNTFEAWDKTDVKETLIKVVELLEKRELIASSLGLFSELKMTTNTKDMVSMSNMEKLIMKMNETTKSETIIHKWIASIDNLDEVINSDPLLKEYEYLLTNIKEENKYMLNENVEEAISQYNISGGKAWSDLQNALTSTLKVEYNGDVTTLSDIRNLAYDPNPVVRKNAYEAEINAYEKIADPIASALNSIKMQAITESNLRGYDSVLDKTLKEAHMKKETLDVLWETIKEYLPKFHDYLRAKGQLLGHDNGCPWYDMFAPVGENDTEYTTEQAKETLLSLFHEFDEEMESIVKRAFDEAWIDFYPHSGKVGGAFCAGVLREKQFRILTNFGGQFTDVVTLAHELGHGFHDFMTHGHRPMNNSYSMPIAETASTFNENIVMHAALAKADDKLKLTLLEGELSDVTQIICDIYSRFLFEDAVINNRTKCVMSSEDLCEMMLKAQKEAYGNGLDQSCLHPYMWVCKGHYYSADLNYYNFPYAFGGLFARGLYEKYALEKESFVSKYKEMLKMTPVMSVEDVAKVCDIDLTDKAFWKLSLDSISKDIDTFIELAKNVK